MIVFESEACQQQLLVCSVGGHSGNMRGNCPYQFLFTVTTGCGPKTMLCLFKYPSDLDYKSYMLHECKPAPKYKVLCDTTVSSYCAQRQTKASLSHTGSFISFWYHVMPHNTPLIIKAQQKWTSSLLLVEATSIHFTKDVICNTDLL